MSVVKTSFGFAFLREPPAEGYRKVLITGLGRTGTSSIASILRHAGFYLGNVELSPTREDPTLREMLAKGQIGEVRATLDKWDASHPLIAWKDPKLIGEHGRRLVHDLPADWAVIVTFRDPLATTMRLVSQHGGGLVERLTTAIRMQKKLLRMVGESQKTLLLVSYEKLMNHPEKVCRDLFNLLVPRIASNINVVELWEKAKVDQKLYLTEAEKTHHREPPHTATEKRKTEKPREPASARKRSARPSGARTGGARKRRPRPDR